VWLRHEFPWLDHGFVSAVNEQCAVSFEADLVRLGFELRVLDGNAMVDEAAFWNHLKLVFGFPSYFGNNWAAFHDSFGDLVLPLRLAVVWRRADDFAARQLKLFSEAIAVLHETFLPLQECQGIVVVTGDGPAFARPK
jgi:RNAse (barnase) inhibitor barstar